MKLTSMFVVGSVALSLCAFVPPVAAQGKPPKPGEERHRIKEMKERRDELKEERKEKKEELKDKKEELAEKRDRHKELKEKEKAGTLTEEEKAELARMEDRFKEVKERHKELKEKHQELKKTWQKRRDDRRKRLLEKYPNIAGHPAAIAEMKVHSRRMARLNRAKAVAQADGRDDLVAKIDELIAKEQARHDKWMETHKDKIQ